MHELDCGFLPIGDAKAERFQGVVTDRDIVVRGVAAGRDPQNTPVENVMSDEVLYGPKTKRFSGIVSLGDILRHDQRDLASKTAAAVTQAA